MLQPASLGIDVGSTGCRFAVVVDGRPTPLWVSRQFDDALCAGVATDPAGEALAWKEALGHPDPRRRLPRFGPSFVRDLFLRGIEAAIPVLGQRPQRAVLCVPAAYPGAQRQVLQQCAVAAGLTESALLSDALALAVAHAEQQPLGNFLVYHCGQHGLEIAVVSVLHGSFNALGYRTSPLLSGRVLERVLVDLLLKQLPPGTEPELAARHPAEFRQAALLLRRRLQLQPWAAVRIQIGTEGPFSAIVQREAWEKAQRDLLTVSLSEVDAALATARLRPANLSEVLLAGGPTALPLVAELLSSHLGRPVLRLPPWSAAFGAALLANRLSETEARDLLETSRGLATPDVELFAPTLARVREQDELLTIELPARSAAVASATPRPREGATATVQATPGVEQKLARRTLEQAWEMLKQKRPREAVALSHQAYHDDSKNPEIFTAMLDIHRRAAETCNTPEGYPLALEWLLCANGHAPGHIQIRQALAERHILHGWQMLESGKVAEALEAGRRAFQLRPEYPETERLLEAIQKAQE